MIYSIYYFHSYKSLSSIHKYFSLIVTQDYEPKTYEEACKNENWQGVMKDELEELAINDTWKFVDLPPNVKPIGIIWV